MKCCYFLKVSSDKYPASVTITFSEFFWCATFFLFESAGMEATGDGPMNYEEWKKWIDWMDAKGLSWITWSVSDKNETCSILKPSAGSNGKWKNEDIKESGLKTREYLRAYPSVRKIPRR